MIGPDFNFSCVANNPNGMVPEILPITDPSTLNFTQYFGNRHQSNANSRRPLSSGEFPPSAAALMRAAVDDDNHSADNGHNQSVSKEEEKRRQKQAEFKKAMGFSVGLLNQTLIFI